jgi:hypothetical protein
MTTTTRATTSGGASGYTLCVINRNTWRIYHDPKEKENTTEQHLKQYYFHEESNGTRDGDEIKKKIIQKSFPYHHCLMKASHSSSQTTVDAQCLYPYFKTKQKIHTEHIDSMHALARIHEHEDLKTPFTELTAFQKTHLTAQSAMTGLIVSRLFKISSAKPWTIQCSKKHADLTTKYIHSALASEYLIGCRYYYNLPTVLTQETRTVGNAPILRNMTAENATFEKIQDTRAQLVALYSSNIARLEHAIKQFKRGFISLQTIREDTEYKKMLEIFWLLQSQCMKYRDVVTLSLNTRQVFCEKNNITFDNKSIHVMVCNLVFSCQAICPKLLSYDIAHVFDNCAGSYARYVKTTKAKQLELCNQGLVSGFLTFAAIEPKLVSAYLAPHTEEPKWHHPSEFSRYAFHIPSRDTNFGSLLLKHRTHIPRPDIIERTLFITKDNKQCFYLPVEEALVELQTGKKAAKESWKKNKRNFKENRIVTTTEMSKRIV